MHADGLDNLPSVAEMVADIGRETGENQSALATRLGVTESALSKAIKRSTTGGAVFLRVVAEHKRLARAQRMRGRDADRMREEIRGFLVYLDDDRVAALWRKLAVIARDELDRAIGEQDAEG